MGKLNTELETITTGWDAIVIGSGLTGMTTAVGLANQGKKVLILEQHYKPGGYATSFRRKGFTFDVSLHQTSGLGEGGTLRNILTELGVMKKITPILLNEAFRIRTEMGDLSMGPEFLNQLKMMFPDDSARIDRLDKTIESIKNEFEKVLRLSIFPGIISRILVPILAPTVRRYRKKTLAEYLDELGFEGKLRNIIASQWGYFGLPTNKISAILYLLAWGSFLKEEVYYIEGSSQSLSNAFIERLEELGGQIMLNHHVEKILVENGRTIGVISRSVKKEGYGDVFEHRASVIVSNADPFTTFDELLDKENCLPKSYLSRRDQLEPSTSAVVVFIGLDCLFETLSKEKHHTVVHIDDDTDFERMFQEKKEGKNKGYDGVTDYTSMDPSLSPEGKTSMVALRNEFMTSWQGLTDEEYRIRKSEVVEEILSALDERYPGFREHIEVIEAATPRTMIRYTGNHKGAFNGFAYTVDRVGTGRSGLDIKTPIDGLYLASAWVGSMSGGFYGCIACGFMASEIILRGG